MGQAGQQCVLAPGHCSPTKRKAVGTYTKCCSPSSPSLPRPHRHLGERARSRTCRAKRRVEEVCTCERSRPVRESAHAFASVVFHLLQVSCSTVTKKSRLVGARRRNADRMESTRSSTETRDCQTAAQNQGNSRFLPQTVPRVPRKQPLESSPSYQTVRNRAQPTHRQVKLPTHLKPSLTLSCTARRSLHPRPAAFSPRADDPTSKQNELREQTNNPNESFRPSRF